MNLKNLSSYPIILILAVFSICLPSMTWQAEYWVNGNISWLMIAAERLLSGQSLSEHIYENNPPLSILLYAPHVILSQITGLERADIVYPYTFFCTILSTFAIYKLSKPWTILSEHQKASFLFGYFAAVTIGTTLFISEREHYIILTLVPFILAQYNLTNNIKTSHFLLWPVLLIGSAVILVKPHYGIVPTYFLLNRLCRHKTIKALLRADFWALSAATLTYGLLLATIFNDYVTVIFHDVVTLYFGHPDVATTMKTAELYLVIFLLMPAIELFQKDLTKEQKTLLFTFYISCLLCLIPYFVQMKGYYYHMTPAYIFFLCGLTLSLGLRMQSFFKTIPALQSIATALALLSFLNVFTPLSTNVLTKKEVKEIPIAQFIKKECATPCTFYAFHGDIETFIPIAFANNFEFGSRFSAYWFLPELMKGLQEKKDKEFESLRYKYSTMVTRDLEFYAPSLLLIRKDIFITPDKPFNYMSFFGDNHAFKRVIIQNYSYMGTRAFDSAPYFKGTNLGGQNMMIFDIYKRKD